MCLVFEHIFFWRRSVFGVFSTLNGGGVADTLCKSMKNPTAIASFESEDFAGRVARKLRYAGFDARVRCEPPAESASSELGQVPGLCRVIVPAIQTARALSWCREFDAAEALLSQALRCPQCGSTRVTGHLRKESGLNEGGTRAIRGFLCHACFSSWAAAPVVPLANQSAAA